MVINSKGLANVQTRGCPMGKIEGW
jgi:hypothetical protein